MRADKHDADYWLSAETLAKADKGSKGFVQGAQSMLGPYVQAGKFKPFEGDTELVPGMKAHAAYGHTPGTLRSTWSRARARSSCCGAT